MGKTDLDAVRRRRVSAVNGKRVLQLRAQGRSWQDIANDFGSAIKSVQVAANFERKRQADEGTNSPTTT
jgi:hypothetical protein